MKGVGTITRWSELLLHLGPSIPRRSCSIRNLSRALKTDMAYYYHHGLILICDLWCAGDTDKREDVRRTSYPAQLLHIDMHYAVAALKGNKHLCPFRPYCNTPSFDTLDLIKGTTLP